jgi:hypothetical protein
MQVGVWNSPSNAYARCGWKTTTYDASSRMHSANAGER